MKPPNPQAALTAAAPAPDAKSPFAPGPRANGAAAQALVLLGIGPWVLALPRHEVRELLSPDALGASGWPVLELDDALDPVAADAPVRPIGVVLDGRVLKGSAQEARVREGVTLDGIPRDGLTRDDGVPDGDETNAGSGLYVLTCDRFEHRVDGEAVRHAVPPASRSAGSPVLAVLRHAGGVAALTSARALALRFNVQWPQAAVAAAATWAAPTANTAAPSADLVG